jgi:hypothetical protein
VAKIALGRGLRHLMRGTKPANSPAQTALPLAGGQGPDESPAVGPGLGSLLQGPRPDETNSRPQPSSFDPLEDKVDAPRSLAWTLLAADLLLVVLAIWIVLRGPSRPGPTEILLVVAALGLGAWLGCCAFLFRR